MKDTRKPIIEFKDVSFGYHSIPILKNVSFSVYPGEFVGLIGPNGGGKTTLLKLLLGFLKPYQGTIQIANQTIDGKVLPGGHIAYVPQTIRFDRDFPISVIEVVLSGVLSKLPWNGWFRSSEKEAARQALNNVGLSHLESASFGTLSGGQAQRVLIARALVSNPKILLLDEPTASVDSKAEEEIYAILNHLKGALTMLMVTHDLNAVISHVEKVFCVQGRVYPLETKDICEHYALGLFQRP